MLCRPFVQTWAQQHLPDAVNEGSREYLLALFEEHVDAGLAWVRSHGSEYVASVDIALVTSLTSLVQVRPPDQPHMSCLPIPCVSVASNMLLPQTEPQAFHGSISCVAPVLTVASGQKLLVWAALGMHSPSSTCTPAKANCVAKLNPKSGCLPACCCHAPLCHSAVMLLNFAF